MIQCLLSEMRVEVESMLACVCVLSCIECKRTHKQCTIVHNKMCTNTERNQFTSIDFNSQQFRHKIQHLPFVRFRKCCGNIFLFRENNGKVREREMDQRQYLFTRMILTKHTEMDNKNVTL